MTTNPRKRHQAIRHKDKAHAPQPCATPWARVGLIESTAVDMLLGQILNHQTIIGSVIGTDDVLRPIRGSDVRTQLARCLPLRLAAVLLDDIDAAKSKLAQFRDGIGIRIRQKLDRKSVV